MRERRAAQSLSDVQAAYDEVYRRAEYGDKEILYEQVWNLMKLCSGDELVDVACGAGQWLQFLAGRGVVALGLELSAEALLRARARAPAQPLLLADGGALPLASDSCRRLTCLGSLEHFLDPAVGAAELARVLSADGLALVMLPNAYYIGDLWRVLRTGYGPNHHQIIDRFASLNEWRDLLQDSGLEVIAVARYDKGKRLRALFPLPFAYHFLYLCRKA